MGKLLYFPILSYGHLNIGIALANHLLDQYGDQHEVYFVVDEEWEAKLKPKNPRFIYKTYQNPLELNASEMPKEESNCESSTDDDATDPLELKMKEAAAKNPMIAMVTQIARIGHLPLQEQVKKSWAMFVKSFERFEQAEPELKRIIDEVQPDFILSDQIISMPFIAGGKIPWAPVVSANPLAFGIEELPPCFSGMRMDQSDQWAEFRANLWPVIEESWNVINNWLLRNNCRPLRHNFLMYESPYFNIYCYPKELDYNVPLPGRWLQLESAIAPTQKVANFALPDHFNQLPGRLIYFSMGSLFSAYLPLMQRLLNMIAQIPHRFIVSKGPLGDNLTMPDNCWGENFLDQKAVLSKVDLIISHGGNNTTIESFHFGVPMIILPICGDQYDNGTRLEDTGLGRQLKTFECTKEELEAAIEAIFSDDALQQKLKQAATRIQSDNGTKAITDEILRYLNKNL
jgi:MGT family glycosyltransferase